MSLACHELSHRYGSSENVLSSISVEIKEASTTALLGPSGSGKTTLLAILGLLQPATAGSLRYDGTVIPNKGRTRTRAQRDIAWSFQTSNLLPRWSALENVMLGPLSLGVKRPGAERAATEVLATLGLAALQNSKVRLLSGGEAQRVGVARALAMETRYLFADEPTGQLDASTTVLVSNAFARRTQQGLTTVIATHDLVVAEKCDTVYRIVNGSLELAA